MINNVQSLELKFWFLKILSIQFIKLSNILFSKNKSENGFNIIVSVIYEKKLYYIYFIPHHNFPSIDFYLSKAIYFFYRKLLHLFKIERSH